ncbi:MAG: ABC transporter ATP-binding protein [Candidatus Latescibacterota bacterium]
MLQFDDVTKTYGKRPDSTPAVDPLSRTGHAGEVVGFQGPHGAGKTTSIKMCATLLQPTSGRVLVDGQDVTAESLAVRAVLGYLPENPFLYERLSARQMLSFVGEARELERGRLARRTGELLTLLELDEAADQAIRTYSYGMRKKVAIAAALLHDPHVLLLDEPTSGLDPRSARVVKDLITGLRDRGTTVFLSTHILEVAERMCDRAGIIHQGRLVAVGSMEELRAGRDATLEDIFLEVTGGAEVRELARYLEDRDRDASGSGPAATAAGPP